MDRAGDIHHTRTTSRTLLEDVGAVLNPTSCAVARATKSRGEDPTCHDERVSDDLVSVLWTSSLVEAEIAKGRLEAESIPVQLVGEGADDPLGRKLNDELLALMEQELALDSPACEEGALHGLGHWARHYPERVGATIDAYLKRNPALSPELKNYALSAKAGCVL